MSSSSSASASNSRPVAAKNASSSVSAPYLLLDRLRRLEGEQPPAVEDADAVREHLGLRQVVRAEKDGRVVRVADLADELLHLELRARVEPRRGLVEQEDDRRGQEGARERDLLLHPSGERLHRLVAAVRREADALEDLRDLRACLLRRHPVVAGGVAQVLRRGHLLEEGRLDRDPVHDPADRAVLRDHVVAEDACVPAVRQQERREQADERRLPRAVLPEDRHRLACRHRERDAVEGNARAALAALLAALAGVLATELLAQLVHLDGYALLHGHGLHDCFLNVDHLMLLRSCA